MNKKQKYLKLILSVTLSSLLTVLAVFTIVHAETYLRESEFRVDGGAMINAFDPDYSAEIGLLVPAGKVGIGLGGELPQTDLDVNGGWVRASGGRFSTVIVDGYMNIGSDQAADSLGFRFDDAESSGQISSGGSITLGIDGWVNRYKFADGGIILNIQNRSIPTCNSGRRGMVWFGRASSGQDNDELYICRLQGSGSDYQWYIPGA